MTRFEKEISGQLGDFWQRHAKQEVERLVEQAKSNAVVEEDGAIFWKSNGSYIPDDYCEKLEYAGFNFSRCATAIKRDAQQQAFLAEYQKKYKEPSAEELFEMRCAFGEGSVVVDVITGAEIRL